MPGVDVKTDTRSGPSSSAIVDSGQVFLVGMAERGPTDRAVTLTGMADFARYLGDRTPYGSLYDAVRMYFEEGGSKAVVARVVGPAATVGTVAILDRAAVGAVATLRADAASAGAWSSRLRVIVTNGTVAGTYRLRIELDGEKVDEANNLATVDAAVTRFANSPYVRFTNMGSLAAPPNNLPALGEYALSAGNDDRAAVNAAALVAALARFPQGMGDGAVAIPGQAADAVTANGSTVGEDLIAHAEANRRIALLAGLPGSSDGDLRALAGGFSSEYAGLFGPHVLVADGAGGSRRVSPEGYVAGVRARAHQQVGPWQAPGGDIAHARFVLGPEFEWDRETGDALDAARVNAIRVINGKTTLYGWRSLSVDEQNYALLTGRDLLNRLVVESERRLEKYVFRTIDGRGALLASIHAELVGLADPIRAAGGLFELIVDGEQVDPGYKVDTGSNVNSVESLANNEVRAVLAVRISPTAALVSLTIVKVGVTAAV